VNVRPRGEKWKQTAAGRPEGNLATPDQHDQLVQRAAAGAGDKVWRVVVVVS